MTGAKVKKIFSGMAAVVLVLALILAVGCGKEKAQNDGASFAKITDDAGREVNLPAKPQRIVVTSASFLEPLRAVGGDVVGRPDSKTLMPDWAKDKKSVGKVYAIDMEALIACNPDLVIINKGMNEKLIPALEESHIPAMVVGMKNFADIKREVEIFSTITGEKEQGAKIVADMEKKLADIKSRIPRQGERVMILHSTNQGLSVELNGTIAGSAADYLGFKNLAEGMTPAENNPDITPYSMETLVESNPDIIFVTSMGKIDEIKRDTEAMMAENPAWQTVKAVKDGRVYFLPQDLFLLSPGLKYPEAVETMAKLVYPDKF